MKDAPHASLRTLRSISLSVLCVEVSLCRFQQPRGLIEIEPDAQRVEPVEECLATIRLELDDGKLVLFLFEYFHELTSWRVGGLAAFDAMRVETCMPTLGGVAIWAARMFLVTIEERPHCLLRRQFFNSWAVTFDLGVGGARRKPDLLCEYVEDAGQTDESCVFSDCARWEVSKI